MTTKYVMERYAQVGLSQIITDTLHKLINTSLIIYIVFDKVFFPLFYKITAYSSRSECNDLLDSIFYHAMSDEFSNNY